MPFGDAALIQPDGVQGGYDLSLAPGAREQREQLLRALHRFFAPPPRSQKVRYRWWLESRLGYPISRRDPGRQLLAKALEREGIVRTKTDDLGNLEVWLVGEQRG